MRLFNTIEKQWIDLMLGINFLGRDILRRQLTCSHIILEDKSYSNLSLILETSSTERYLLHESVPIIMQAYQSDGVPIEFLIHIVDGFVRELEVYNAAGLELQVDKITLDKLKYEVRV